MHFLNAYEKQNTFKQHNRILRLWAFQFKRCHSLIEYVDICGTIKPMYIYILELYNFNIIKMGH